MNALDVAGWFGLADAVLAAGRVPDNRVVILRAEGRGFCAGVDIKEIQAQGDEALIGANRGCFAAFAAVYECEVPVIAAVHGFCLGGGVGLAGNADIVVASEDATFGLPEVDRGALGAATHLSRLVPQHRMRSMVYTAKPATAAELHHYGSVLRVVPRERAGRRRLRGRRRTSPPRARPSSAGPRSPSTGSTRSTSGAATASSRGSPTSSTWPAWPTSSVPPSSRSATPTPPARPIGDATMSDKRLTLDELVGELRSGMTIGIGGWGSRRKPMAAVRAILRSDLTDLTVVSYGGPDVGLLCAAGKVAKVVYGFVTLDSIPTDPHFKAARQSGAVEAMEVDEGMFYLGLLAASQRLPFLPTRAGLGSDVLARQPVAADGARRPTTTARSWWPCPPCASTPPWSTSTGPTPRGSGQILGPDPFFDELFLGAADRRFVTTERLVETEQFASEGAAPDHVHQPAADRWGGRDRRAGPTSPPVSPTTAATRRSRRSTWPRPGTRRPGRRSPNGSSRSTRPATRRPP